MPPLSSRVRPVRRWVGCTILVEVSPTHLRPVRARVCWPLAVHPDPSGDCTHSITHVPSGRSLGAVHDPVDARVLAEQLIEGDRRDVWETESPRFDPRAAELVRRILGGAPGARPTITDPGRAGGLFTPGGRR